VNCPPHFPVRDVTRYVRPVAGPPAGDNVRRMFNEGGLIVRLRNQESLGWRALPGYCIALRL